MMSLPQGTNFVTKLKTKILYRMDYIMQCKNDEESLNAWRLLCGDGVTLVRLAMNDGLIKGLPMNDYYEKLAQKVIDSWPPQTFEKTNLKIESNGRYRGNYDHYCVELRAEDLELGLRSLEKEKYNVIANKLMAMWGDCYSIAMVVGFFDLNEEIEIPVKMDDRYTSERMKRGSQKWVTKDDGQRGDSQAPHVEGRAISH
jgi:hypothetical protein